MDDQTNPAQRALLPPEVKQKLPPEPIVPAKLSPDQAAAIGLAYAKLAALEWRYRQAKDPLRKDEARALRKATKALALQFPFLEDLAP